MRPVAEQHNRFRVHEGVAANVVAGHAEGGHGDDLFARHREPLAARCEDGDTLTTSAAGLHQRRNRVEEVLAVVDHQQQTLRGQIIEHDLVERATWHRQHVKGRRHRLSERVRIAERRELAHPHAVRKVRDDFGRDLERQSRLAHSPDTSERHQRP